MGLNMTRQAKPTSKHSSLYHRVSRLRWQVALLAIALVFLHQWIEHAYLFFLPRWTHFWTQVVFYGVVGPVLAWLALNSLREQIAETDQAERDLRRSRDKLASVNRRLQVLVDVERRLVEAEDEEQLTRTILELPLEVVPALGTTLFRFDEQRRPLSASHEGKLNPEEFRAWTAHLAASDTADQCSSCQALRASTEAPCPVFDGASTEIQTERIHCLPLSRGERKYGMLTVYLDDSSRPTAEEAALLDSMANGMSLALESQLLRSREISALHRLQHVHQLQGLDEQLREILNHTLGALDLDGAAFFLQRSDEHRLEQSAWVAQGEHPGEEFLRGFASSVEKMTSPWVAGELDVEPEGAVSSLVVAPLRKEGRWLGSLLLWSRRSTAPVKRQIRIVESVASQAALLVDIHHRYNEIEYHAALAERERLAREIHDALAQTLGYLKLRTAQLGRWLEEGKTERAGEGLGEIRRLLDEAYVDAREAIDGLRLRPMSGEDLQASLEQVYREFSDLSQIEVEASPVPAVSLAPEMHAQLLRILQEALGNIRKHAGASCARVGWDLGDHYLTLRVQDEGCGFNPEDVPSISRHGLRIMKERAELLGADFQVISRVGEGTEVVVRLPLAALDQEKPHG